MNYKTGEVPQPKDEVLGDVDGKPARGRVVAVREKVVTVTRRAAYTGPQNPLAAEHVDVDPAALSLIYRPIPKGAPLPSPKPAPKVKAAAAKKESVKK